MRKAFVTPAGTKSGRLNRRSEFSRGRQRRAKEPKRTQMIGVVPKRRNGEGELFKVCEQPPPLLKATAEKTRSR